jgi:hypothetical protein
VLVLISLTAILAVASLSIDAGNLLAVRRSSQNAADSAAEAAALQLYREHTADGGRDTSGRAQASALAAAALHGYGSGDPHSSVVVHIPPVTGTFAGELGFVEVECARLESSLFSSLFGIKSFDAPARAVAAGTLVPSRAGLLVLEPKKGQSLRLQGRDSSLRVAGDIFVNSENKMALRVVRSGQVEADHILVSGQVERRSKQNLKGEVITGIEATADPYSDLPPPPSSPTRKARDYQTVVNGQNIYELVPGTYGSITFDKNDIVKMEPGVYEMSKGMTLRGDAFLEAYEVMLYFPTKKTLKLDSRNVVKLTPPQFGQYAGFSVFVDREVKGRVELKRETSLEIDGVIYAPNCEVRVFDVDPDIGDDLGDDDFDEINFDDELPIDRQSLSVSIVCRTFRLGKSSHVEILDASIGIQRPLLGLVE